MTKTASQRRRRKPPARNVAAAEPCRPARRRCQTPLARVLAQAAEAWAPVKKPPRAEWCQSHLFLPGETSADPGPIDWTGREFWIEPLSMMDDPDVRTISLMADAQGGKTVLALAALISESELSPCPAMVAGPDQDSMRELRDRVYEMCLASPTLKHRIPPRRLWNDRWLDLGTMYAYLAYSGSRQRLRGRTCKRVFCTEVDVWTDNPKLGQSSKLIQARTKAFHEFTILYESTPTDQNSTIAAFEKEGDRRRYKVPCPHCGHAQELRFFPHKSGPFAGKGGVAGLRDDNGREYTADEVRRHAFYLCEQGCRIDSHHQRAMARQGRWVPRGQSVRSIPGHAPGEWRLELEGTPQRSRRNVSYHIATSLFLKPFGEVAGQYIDHREAGQLREFFNNWLGLPYLVGNKVPDWRTLAQRLAVPGHRIGSIPREAWFLTCAADVQADHLRYAVRAWGDNRTSWLVEEDCIRSEHADTRHRTAHRSPQGNRENTGLLAPDFALFEQQVVFRTWPVVGGKTNPLGRSELAIRLIGIDTNFRMFEIHDLLRRHPGDRMRAVRGDESVARGDLFRMTTVERNARTNKPYEGGLQLWGLLSHVFREQLLQLFESTPGQPGAFMLPEDIHEHEDYLKQLVNRVPVTVVNAAGKKTIRWLTRDKLTAEHFFDIEVINLALAHMVTGGNWDLSRWARPVAARAVQQRPSEPILPRDHHEFEAR